MAVSRGLHFFQNPGPTNIPDRILRAMDRGTIDFTGAQFKAIPERMLRRPASASSRPTQTILGYAATGHGAWEAALVNLFSPGDKVLIAESGYFSMNWGLRGEAFGLEVETLANDWRRAVDPAKLEARLREDQRARDQGGARGAQRNLDRRRPPDRGDAPGDRRGAAPGAVPASTRSPRSARSISAWTNGASTSSSSARRKG